MRDTIESIFPCDPSTVIRYIKLPATMVYIAKPLILFTPIKPATFPEVWNNGKYEVIMKMFGLIPFRKQEIGI